MHAGGLKCMDLLLEMRPPELLLLFTCFPYIMRDHRRGFLLLFDTADNKHPPAKRVVLLMRAKPYVPRARVKRVSTVCQLRRIVTCRP